MKSSHATLARNGSLYAALGLALASGAAGCRRTNAPNGTQPVASASTNIVIAPSVVAPSVAATAATANVAATAPSAPAGAVAGSATNTATAGSLGLTHGKVVLFRAPDSNWHLRVTLALRNTGATPVDVDRSHFVSAEWSQSSAYATLPDHVSINPGMTSEGDITFYRAGTDPQPTSFTLQYVPGGENTPVVWQATYAPAFSPAPPVAGQAPSRVVYTLPVTPGAATSWVNPDDQNPHVRVTYTVANPLDVPIVVSRDYFHLYAGTTEASSTSTGATFNDPTTIAPGATATFTPAWYFSAGTALTGLRFTYGPSVSPQFDRQIPVTAGAPPAQ